MITVYISIHTYYTFMLRLTCICTYRERHIMLFIRTYIIYLYYIIIFI